MIKKLKNAENSKTLKNFQKAEIFRKALIRFKKLWKLVKKNWKSLKMLKKNALIVEKLSKSWLVLIFKIFKYGDKAGCCSYIYSEKVDKLWIRNMCEKSKNIAIRIL